MNERHRLWTEEDAVRLAGREAQKIARKVERDRKKLLEDRRIDEECRARDQARRLRTAEERRENARKNSQRLRLERKSHVCNVDVCNVDSSTSGRALAANTTARAPRRALPEFRGPIPSFLEEEYKYMSGVSSTFPETITPDVQMSCLRAYQKAISTASKRLPCGICGGLYQEVQVLAVSLQDMCLQNFLRETATCPDSCAIKGGIVGICCLCNSWIAKAEIPPLSAGNFVNRLFCQDYPDVLRRLNTVEERFIARAHVIGTFLKLTSGAQKGSSYRGGRGHYVAVKQDPSNLLTILPTRDLLEHTTITVSWERETPPSEDNLARFCSVDKNKVLLALLWLCANNPVYKEVTIDYELLDSWPDNHIPQEIRDAFLVLGARDGPTGAVVADEREGYATNLRDGLFENDLDAELEAPEPGNIISRYFFSDFHGQDMQTTPAVLASLQAVLDDTRSVDPARAVPDTGGHAYPIPHVSYNRALGVPLLNSYTDPEYFTGAFPTLFPYGTGGHLGDISGDRPKKVSLEEFAKYAMMHHSHIFSQHPNFMFYLYDLILLRQASFGNHLQVKKGYWTKATADLATLSGDDLYTAAAQFKTKEKISNPIIHTLLNNMRIISSFNPESYGEKIRLRNLIFGKIGRLGIPLIWFTLNPQDIGNIFVVKLAGEDIPLDNTEHRLDLIKLTLKNPALVAQYFHTIVNAFFDCFFKSLAKEIGIFGTVSSHFGVVESTTRMMMHIHGFAWLTGNFGATNLSNRLVADPDFRDRLIGYVKCIVRETVDLTDGQRYRRAPAPGSAVLDMPSGMTPTEFQSALDKDSNDVAARVQMHTHSATCTKYKRISRVVPAATEQDQHQEDQPDLLPTQFGARSLLDICRFLFPRPLVPESMITENGLIRMERNHQFVNKYNPVIASAIRCNHDINFTPSSPRVLASIFYMTNYATKSQTDRGQLVLAAAVLKKAQEAAEADAAANSGLTAPKPFDISTFALKAYNRFTRDVEVGAPAVAHFLLGQPSFYIPDNKKPSTINFYWVKTYFKIALTNLLDASPDYMPVEDSQEYNSFGLNGRRPSIYENYRKRGARLSQICFYEYISQFSVQTFRTAAGRSMCFPFDPSHPLCSTHIQVSAGSRASLATPSLCGSFTRLQEHDGATVPNTSQIQDEIDETLLGLFYPWNNLRAVVGPRLKSLRDSQYRNSYIWDIVKLSLPPYLLHLSENIMLLRRSKEAADQDRRDRGLEFNDYIEAVDDNLYNEEHTTSGLDFATIQPTHLNLLEAALEVRGILLQHSSQLRYLRDPAALGSLFCDTAIVASWGKKMQSYTSPGLDNGFSTTLPRTAYPSTALVPSLDLPIDLSITLPGLQSLFCAKPTANCLVSLVVSAFPLNYKQKMVCRALFARLLQPIVITRVEDQFLLYIGGVGGTGKTHLIKSLMFGLSIIQKRDEVLLTASTGAAAANIGGTTYHSALSIYGNRPVGQAARLRLSHKKIFIIDEISMVSLEDLVKLDKRCNSVWDFVRETNTVFGGLPVVIFLGDFNQFQPVGGRSIWTQNTYNSPDLLSGRSLWCHLNQVVFLTEQMRQANDLPYQDMLQRARLGTLTENDVAILNSQTVDAGIRRGDIPPDRAVVRVNKLREEVNIKQLELFAKKRKQKIYLFPGRHDGPTVDNLDPALLLKNMFQVGEAGKLKGPGFFAFSKGMPIMLLQNTSTRHGLVNGMTATAEETVLDKSIQATWIQLDDLYVLCTSPLVSLLVRPGHDHGISLSGVPDTLVPILPSEMEGEITNMGRLPFYRHQVPVTLGFAVTDYKCQGSTFENLILDLHFTPQRGLSEHQKWTSINVQLGRLKSLSGVWLREPITLADVQASPHKDLKIEISRLENIEQDTIRSWTV